ncbi:hypothetical protein FQA39_LY03332 [Lamprigera yunnana]|nr:hypothetical protein FQA39_LY03332 [Lamprigera yunnana]
MLNIMYSNSLFNALNPMFFISSLFGTNPIYSSKNKGRYVLKSSNVFKLITVIYLGVYSTALTYGITNYENKMVVMYFGNAISSIGLVLDAIGQILLIYTIYMLSFVIPKNIKNIIEKISTVDSIFMDIGYNSNYNKIFWQQILLYVTGFFSITFAMVFQFFVVSNQSIIQLSSTNWFIYYFPLFVIFVMEFQFAILVYLIYERFRMLNQILADMSKNNESEVKMVQKIQTVMEVHDSLLDAGNDINLIYSFQILVCLTLLFIKTVFSLFFAYFEQFARQVGVEIHKLLMTTSGNEIRDKLFIFSQQVFHRPVEFTACGLFSIDAPLLFTIIGSGTVYLLIMMQFQEGTGETNCTAA